MGKLPKLGDYSKTDQIRIRPKREQYNPRNSPPPTLPNFRQLQEDINVIPIPSEVERRYEMNLADHVRVIWENDIVENGLQCKRSIPNGSYLGRYYGEEGEYDNNRTSVYDVVLKSKKMLLVDKPTRYAHYANHCKTRAAGHCNAQLRQIGNFRFLLSIRDIKENEFIHWKYFPSNPRDSIENSACVCNITGQVTRGITDILTMERKQQKGGVFYDGNSSDESSDDDKDVDMAEKEIGERVPELPDQIAHGELSTMDKEKDADFLKDSSNNTTRLPISNNSPQPHYLNEKIEQADCHQPIEHLVNE